MKQTVRTYAYRAVFEAGDEFGLVVSFPDVPEAITQGEDRRDAIFQAEEALGLALLSYVRRGLPLPEARASDRELVEIAVAPDVAAKLAILEAFAEADISKSELARRLGKDEKEIRRILDPFHPTKLATLIAALAILGRQLRVSMVNAA
jgi:antitoxin HicB